MSEILKCTQCKKYTIYSECDCGGKALSNKPAKYSPDDKYSSYRLKYKKENKL
jgi:H/ACA ribonucleoprotein complex subunit 3